MTISAFPIPYTPFKGFANDGTPLSGGLLYSYAAGTVTPLATWQDSGQVSLNTNPVVLNARGEANVFTPVNVAYKFLLTDPLGNTIPGWPIDNLVLQQLITLYGGVDTGNANAYVLNFTASFSSLVNGIVIYWVAAHSNTGASTINVNGLGVVPLVNPDGSALSANQVLASYPIQMMYYSGNFILLNGSFVSGALVLGSSLTVTTTLTVTGITTTNGPLIATGGLGSAATPGVKGWGPIAAALVDMTPDKSTFTGTLTGMTAGTTGTVNFTRQGNSVTLYVAATISGTSNAITMTMTGIPASLQPTNTQFAVCGNVRDNGSSYLGSASITAGTITFTPATVVGSTVQFGGAFTGSGTKGLVAGWTITYSIG